MLFCVCLSVYDPRPKSSCLCYGNSKFISQKNGRKNRLYFLLFPCDVAPFKNIYEKLIQFERRKKVQTEHA